LTIVADLSIIIVSYNARADLERCLASLHPPRTASVPGRHDIVVVDNASTDGSAAAARTWPDVRVIASDSNRGFAAATNTGIRATSGENLLLLNSDTVLPSGAPDALVHELERHPEAAVAGPRLVDGEGRAELSFGRMISPASEWRQRRLVRGHARRDPAVSRLVEQLTLEEQWPDWVSGACLLVRRADAEAVGLLDERYFMYTEDVDFCAAIRARGRGVLFTPRVEVKHLRGRSAATAPAATRAARRSSHLAFYQKHHPGFAPFLRAYHQWRRVRERFHG
jgi:GT2 family glycosyltransferase